MKQTHLLFVALLACPAVAEAKDCTIAQACEAAVVRNLSGEAYRHRILALADKHPESLNVWLPQEGTLFTPLQYAIQRQDAELVRELLERGAIPYRPHTGYDGSILKDYDGRLTEDAEISRLVNAETSRYNLFDLVLCSQEYHAEMRKKGLIDLGSSEDFYAQEPGPLNEAILSGANVASIRTLVAQNPQAINRVSYINGVPCTTLQLALRLGNAELVQDLLSAGAIPFACTGGEEDILAGLPPASPLRDMLRKAQRRYSLIKLVEDSEVYRYRNSLKSQEFSAIIRREIDAAPIIICVQLHTIRSLGGDDFYTVVEDIGTVQRCYKGQIPQGAAVTLPRGVENAQRKTIAASETKTNSTCLYTVANAEDAQLQPDGSWLMRGAERVQKTPRFIERTWLQELKQSTTPQSN